MTSTTLTRCIPTTAGLLLCGILLAPLSGAIAAPPTDQPSVAYPGRDPRASWRRHARRDIRRHRTAELTVRVVDAGGAPITGATVQVEMRRHAFGFGTAINTRTLWLEGPDGVRYRQTLTNNFNKVTTEDGLRWQNWTHGTPGTIAARKTRLGRTLDWCARKGLPVRGHYLMWAPLEARNKPPELLSKRDALLDAFWSHAEKKATWAGDRVAEWDVINHIVGWNIRFADVYGERVYAGLIKRAREWAPHATLWVNEGQALAGKASRLMRYRRVIANLKKANAAPDGIGVMGHFQADALPHPEELYRRLSFLGNTIPRVQVTELDVDAGKDELLQADYFRDVLTVAFSHPAVEGVVLWGFWEGRHWRPDAALWRKDWTLTPAGRVWRDLVFGQWWTTEKGTTDEQGTYLQRAFLGTHRITASHDGRTDVREVTLPQDGHIATLRLP